MTTDFYRHFTALIGDVDAPVCCTTLRTNERLIPRILHDIGVVESTGEVRRNRPDLMREVGGNERIRIGRKVIDIITDSVNCGCQNGNIGVK
ncbi:hypothetical protein [uncultured Paenibacillus sp.]|uniref:hypothetical protein n=1 Tax=uncultured Paenibacillus sp. TaxID=227322 RepID=UPI0015B0C7DC|nr:hypothetical protein [uncultured Paenibacillus sp.]